MKRRKKYFLLKQTSSNLWNSFVDEKTRQEEEEIDALLLEAEDESAMDQFLLQAVNEHDPVKEEFVTTDDDDKDHKMAGIVGACVGLFVITVAISSFLLYKKKKGRDSKESTNTGHTYSLICI